MDHITESLRVVTWNVHRGVGADGRFDPERILRVIADDITPDAPDILVLQEADEDHWPHRGFLDIDGIEAVTGLQHAHGPDLLWGPESHGFLGVIVFVHPRISVLGGRVLDLPGHAHRGAVVLDLALPLRIVATHLSLAQWLRAVQMRAVGQFLHRASDMETVLIGDINEWRPWGGLAFSRAVVGRSLTGPARATFPVGRPILPLDRILGDRPGLITDPKVMDSPGIRAASDHRPLMATIHKRLG
ncbi:MAG: endonuclease/exonuclease/phosphatase family protein [Pseudomonadota bacterium]